MFSGYYGGDPPEPTIGSIINTIFTSEDSLSDFVNNLSKEQRAVLYEYIFHTGTRFTGHALTDWRKRKT